MGSFLARPLAGEPRTPGWSLGSGAMDVCQPLCVLQGHYGSRVTVPEQKEFSLDAGWVVAAGRLHSFRRRKLRRG